MRDLMNKFSTTIVTNHHKFSSKYNFIIMYIWKLKVQIVDCKDNKVGAVFALHQPSWVI